MKRLRKALGSGNSSQGGSRGRNLTIGDSSSNRNTPYNIINDTYYTQGYDINPNEILDHAALEAQFQQVQQDSQYETENIDDDETQGNFDEDTPDNPTHNEHNVEVNANVGPQPPAPRVPRERKKTSEVWEFFVHDKDNDTATCKICQQKYAFKTSNGGGGTGVLRNHMTGKHKTAWNARKNGFFLSGGQGGGGDGFVQQTIDPVTGRPFRYDKMRDRENIAKMVVVEGLPFTFPSSEGFVRYIQDTHKPDFPGFPKTTVRSDVFRFMDEYQTYLRYKFFHLPARVSLTTDIGRSINGNDYLTVTCHWIDENWVMQKRILAYKFIDEPHTGNFIANTVEEICTSYELIRKVICCTMDNASSMTTAADALKNKLVCTNKEAFHVRCACHIYNLIVSDGVAIFDTYVKKVQRAVNYIFRNTVAKRKKEFKRRCHENNLPYRKIPQEVRTRWNTLYSMLKVAAQYKDPVQQTYNFFVQDTNYQLRDDDWKYIDALVEFLEKFYYATIFNSGIYFPTICNMLFYIAGIASTLKEYMEVDEFQAAVSVMVDKFRKYFMPIPEIYLVAAVLNPAIKSLGAQNLVKTIYESIGTDEDLPTKDNCMVLPYSYSKMMYSFYQLLSKSTQSSAASSSQSRPDKRNARTSIFPNVLELLCTHGVQTGVDEMDIYINIGAKSITDEDGNEDILKYWRQHERQYPILSKMARDVLTVQASSVASEQAFSAARFQIGDSRHSLASDTLEVTILFRDWIRAERRNFGLPETNEEEDPIFDETLTMSSGSTFSSTGQQQRREIPDEEPTEIIQKFAKFFMRS